MMEPFQRFSFRLVKRSKPLFLIPASHTGLKPGANERGGRACNTTSSSWTAAGNSLAAGRARPFMGRDGFHPVRDQTLGRTYARGGRFWKAHDPPYALRRK